MMFTEGQCVRVTEPIRDYTGEYLLPGEDIYVLTVRDGSNLLPYPSIRVRCPSSGVDMWISETMLSKVVPA